MDESDDALSKDQENQLKKLPVLPLRNAVLFPGVVLPITVGRQKSIKLVKESYRGDRLIGVVTQSKEAQEDPSFKDLNKVGVLAKIVRLLVLPDGSTTIIIQGKKRFELTGNFEEEPYIRAEVKLLKEEKLKVSKKETKALIQSLKASALKIIKLNPEIPQEAQVALDNIEEPGFLTYFLASNLNASTKDKQKLLETNDLKKRATLLLQHMNKDIQLLEIKNDIHNKTNLDIDQQQRDYYLRQQMRVLQDELGQDGPDQEINKLKAKTVDKKWSKKTAEHFNKELEKLSRLNTAAPEYATTVNYLELLVDLPWDHLSEDNFDLKHAQKVLDKEHYGLEKVKERIIEYLAVLKLKREREGDKKKLRAPIICLYGPPGVGKTSLGKSVAKSLNREYIRMSLGGVGDEAEIRGHRKTYIGAMPGKVIQSIKKAGTSNPVFILDEIDKLSTDFKGDPSSALLEVLDPEQNSTFMDNYLDIEYDLSGVLFIATANSLGTIQPALRDRMEIIEINGYTQEEKIEIAKRHLIPKQRKEHGLTGKDTKINSSAIKTIVEGYTRESGVRGLERKIGQVFRKVAKSIALEEEVDKSIVDTDVKKLLGSNIFDKEPYVEESVAGVVTGLAWTSVGGEILYIESSINRGKGKLTISGQLGSVMKESVIAALSYLKVQANDLGIDNKIFDQFDLHIHVPAGAVPKDGPSAGITMFTSLASVFTQRKVKSKIAMTGEITLTGKVLPVGGIKEKLLAAKRAGIKEIIFCEKNEKDILELDARYLKGLKIHYVSRANEVLDIALLKQKVVNPISLEITSSKPIK
ncbi:MAG: endopeptidase La [Cyclobacteriaceae bacterium]